MQPIKRSLIFLLTCLTFIGCKRNTEKVINNEKIKPSSSTIVNPKIEVEIETIKISDFHEEKIFNGKIKARNLIELKSEIGGVVINKFVEDGQWIKKNDPIIFLDDTSLKLDIQKNNLAVQLAQIKKNDLLIQYGGNANIDTSISEKKLVIINTLSGLDLAQQELQHNKYRLSKMKFRAPLTGRVTNVKINQFEMINPGETICKILDTHSYEASFMVLEDIALKLNVNQKVIVQPLNDPTKKVKAKIKIINPIVDNNGLVEIRAKLSGHSYQFFENMNIKVILQSTISKTIQVPRSSLVIRHGKNVVFTYDPITQRSKWNYVTIEAENDSHLAISEGLEDGDIVIVNGNLNLDQNSLVTIQPHQK